MIIRCLLMLWITVLVTGCTLKDEEQIITEAWHSGETLPVEIGKKYPPAPIAMTIDKGYNFLIDLSHQCSFNFMWGLPDMLHQKGFRSVSSQASLGSVLDEKGVSRIRIPYDPERKIYPFAWYPNFRYNVIITFQNDPSAPVYTEQECLLLKDFVSEGGSLIILADPVKAEQVDNWSLNRLLKSFDASYTKDYQNYKNRRHICLALSEQWIPWEMGSDSLPIRAYREYGKGRIAVGTALDDFLSNGEAGSAFVDQIMDWLCEKQVPVGGEPRLPQTMGGGGAIYPELESVINGMVTYYAPTVNHTLLECIKKEFFKINDTLLQWYPSRQTEEPMFLVLSAGSGGGWAVNSFFPKENGIISQDSASLISIYGHELAHTLAGPVNEKGQAAGDVPFGNQGEAHAGWFQGKVEALYNEELRQHANKKCEDFFRSSEFDKLDLKRYTNDGEYAKQFSYGAGWYKLWYIWQRLDDTYGNTWYARWKHIQYTRWKNDPMRLLTWEEMIEDMSLATGHDLFPFFISLNTSLERREMGEVIYEGKKVKLSGAVIPIIEPGNVCLNPIENYKTIKFE